MSRLTNVHNFVRYRNNFFNDFLITYGLYKYNSNWKHFLKKKCLLQVIFFLKSKQLKWFKIKMMSGYFLKKFFCYHFRLFSSLKLSEYNILINYLKTANSCFVTRMSDESCFYICTNSWSDFVSIHTFLNYINEKTMKRELLFEVSNVVLKLAPLKVFYNLVFYNKFAFVVDSFRRIGSKNFLPSNSVFIFVELLFIQLVLRVYLGLLFYFFNILFFLVNYGNISSVGERV